MGCGGEEGGPHIPKVIVGCAGVSERGGSWQRLPFLLGQLEDGGIFFLCLVELEGGKGRRAQILGRGLDKS